MYTAKCVASLAWISGISQRAISSEVLGEVATAPFIFLPLLPSASIKKLTVLPVPMPI